MTSAIVGWSALLLSMAARLGPSASPPEAVTLRGEVVELTAALKETDWTFDAEPITKQVVLRGRDGSITPLLSDGASRALFFDERLRGRPTEIHARRIEGLPYIQVVSFKVEAQGAMRTPEYYCEICTISVRYPQICPCCQGAMVLRMKPEAR